MKFNPFSKGSFLLALSLLLLFVLAEAYPARAECINPETKGPAADIFQGIDQIYVYAQVGIDKACKALKEFNEENFRKIISDRVSETIGLCAKQKEIKFVESQDLKNELALNSAFISVKLSHFPKGRKAINEVPDYLVLSYLLLRPDYLVSVRNIPRSHRSTVIFLEPNDPLPHLNTSIESALNSFINLYGGRRGFIVQ